MSRVYDNNVMACRQRAREAGLPEVTRGSGNRPCLVQCICGHGERYDLWPEAALLNSPYNAEALLAQVASKKCSKCQKEQKHKTPKQLKAAEKARDKRRANCDHSWEWISHEERKCVRCGEIEFMPDMD